MTYLRRTNVNAKKSRTTTILVVAILVVLFATHYVFPGAYAGLFYPVGTVFWKTESGLFGFFGHAGALVSSKFSLVKENQSLRQEIAARDASALLIDSLKAENESLKNSLNRSAAGDDILGIVLSRPPVSAYDTLVIDIGSDDGVSKGDKVYADGDTLIGDIAEVYANQSKVSLFSTPGRTISVILGTADVTAQAKGRGLGNFQLNIPVEVGVKEGDIIALPQIRPHTFGIVEKIIVDSSDSLQTILFKSPVNINSLRFVEVDRNTK
ncbi:MAG TPA: rod shape-determining protein MreC [Candidatus Paceibacterota bacterium]